jgi:hypothetical protein
MKHLLTADDVHSLADNIVSKVLSAKYEANNPKYAEQAALLTRMYRGIMLDAVTEIIWDWNNARAIQLECPTTPNSSPTKSKS